jgi:organic hydroperoxide reductase OsmC/OhrA
VGRPNIVVSSPPEFKGEPNIWAPEELLAGSLNTCMMLTFLTLAHARGLTPVRYESEAEGLLENVEGKYHITEVTVRPRVTLESEAELEPARKSWKVSKPNASSQIPLAPGSRSPRNLSLLPHQSENSSPSRERSIV